MASDQSSTTQDKTDTHDVTLPLLISMYGEFKELSKKKPDAAISKNKIAIVNRLLQKIRTILNDEESIEFLDLLDEDDIPQTSDVTLILSQYVAAMKAFKDRYFGWNGSEHDWFIDA